MSNDSSASLKNILGQLEDELSRVKSARDQVESVLTANEELKGLTRQANSDSKVAAEALINAASHLTGYSEAIERASANGVDAIRKQASDAQATLEAAADAAVERVASQTDQLMEVSKAMERSSSETVEAVRKQASDGKVALEHAAESAVENVSSEIKGTAEQAIASLNEGISEAKRDINQAFESLEATTGELNQARGDLVESHETASAETQRQIEETKALLEAAQEQLAGIDARITELTSIDIKGLSEEIRGLREAEESSTALLQKQLRNVTATVGICIVICLALLVKLLIA